jgi:7,8-dihydropterin-6-yl-methyl-4-(beta-D-ribofuranosyl)aminobenzene 5'-phosphate synthase
MALNLIPTNLTLFKVYDNYQYNPELITGWGFGCVVKTKDKNILFDTGGDSPTLLGNMEKLEIDPKTIDIIVLSHIHGDHVDGLDGFLEKNPKVTVYIPSSFPSNFRKKIEKAGAKSVDVSSSIKISKNIGTTGELGTWIKEQSLIINSKKGLVIITGCSHPGIVNIVKTAKEITGQNIYLVIGGFHLLEASKVELKKRISNFRELGVTKVAPCHCSGDRARQLFGKEYKDDFISNVVERIFGR